MPESLTTLLKYGYQSLALLLFLEAVGFPVPGALVLLTAGAAAATGLLHPVLCLGVALGAMLTGDILLYLIGRNTGWYLLGLLCRVSINPENCILRSAESFYKRGHKALLFSKFIPGVNTMAPPLAGSMNMSPPAFLLHDLGGATLYISAFWATGFLFSGLIKDIVEGLQTFGRAVEWVLLAALGVYLVYRIRLAWMSRELTESPRMDVQTVAELLADPEGTDIVIADVRSHGYYDKGSLRIKGSMRLDPNFLMQSLHELPTDKKIFLYCT
jgi:membrane protein DedA with SNARE-associated domain